MIHSVLEWNYDCESESALHKYKVRYSSGLVRVYTGRTVPKSVLEFVRTHSAERAIGLGNALYYA